MSNINVNWSSKGGNNSEVLPDSYETLRNNCTIKTKWHIIATFWWNPPRFTLSFYFLCKEQRPHRQSWWQVIVDVLILSAKLLTSLSLLITCVRVVTMLVCCNCCVGPSLSLTIIHSQVSCFIHWLLLLYIFVTTLQCSQQGSICLMLMKERFYIYSWKLDS